MGSYGCSKARVRVVIMWHNAYLSEGDIVKHKVLPESTAINSFPSFIPASLLIYIPHTYMNAR